VELAGCGQYVLEFFTTQIEKADGDLDLLTAVSPLCLSVSLSLSHVCPTLSDSPSHLRTLKMEAANKRLTPIQFIPTPPPPHPTHTHTRRWTRRTKRWTRKMRKPRAARPKLLKCSSRQGPRSWRYTAMCRLPRQQSAMQVRAVFILFIYLFHTRMGVRVRA
jgi:hypothetical protein